jgi:hypothetical protein
MAASFPVWNDNARDLWRKIALNFYDVAIDLGAAGLTPPNWNDSIYDLEKKTAYFSAVIVQLKP